ncbi:glycosyltransferase family 4 protein [Larkinella soli]|uniref:glycosyltransferase family 4 protein n=1 Tax=Larkinella soli TaxID=1770527 RepID=UPI000FFBCCE8|nr:glycosyltransferase family 4 protein [Larkinella soli]
MKILIVHNTLWAHYKSTVFSELARQAPDFGCQVHVLQIARSERSRAGLGKPERLNESYSHELLFDTNIEEVGTLAKTRALIGRMLAYRPDVINLTGYYDPAQLALLLLARAKGIRVVIQNESTPVDQVRSPLKEWIKRRIIGLSHGFFCFGTPQADYLMQLGARPEQILVRKNAVVDNRTLRKAFDQAVPERTAVQQNLNLKPCNFIYVGRLAPEKNLSFFLEAFARTRQEVAQGRQWGLLLLGEGPEKTALQAQAESLNLSDAVHFLPGLPWYRVPERLALADVLVLPSRSEPWGLVVNEAMVCGMPVLVSDRCGCAQDLVRDGVNGYTFDPEQPEVLSRSLERIMSGQADLPAMGRASGQIIGSYTPEKAAAEMLAGFVKVVGR